MAQQQLKDMPLLSYKFDFYGSKIHFDLNFSIWWIILEIIKIMSLDGIKNKKLMGFGSFIISPLHRDASLNRWESKLIFRFFFIRSVALINDDEEKRENEMKVTGTQQVSLKICSIYHLSRCLFSGKFSFFSLVSQPLIIIQPVGNFKNFISGFCGF